MRFCVACYELVFPKTHSGKLYCSECGKDL